MAEKALNKIIVLEPSTKSVTDLLASVKEKGGTEVILANTMEEALQHISVSLPCLFVNSLIDNNAVPQRVQLMKRLENCIKHQGLKVYMVTPIKNRQLADLFTQKMGVTDYIVDPVPTRTMMFKVNLALKAVENFRKQAEIKKAAQEQIVIKKFEGKKVEAAAEVASKGKPALQMAEDTFLFKNGGAKKAGKKFVLEVEGPDPSTGEWQQHEDKGDAKQAWRWVPNEEKEAQAKGAAPADGWVHEGDKPAFNEESGKWALSSEKPALGLKKGGVTVAEKISLDDKGELVIAEDSPAAEENIRKNKVKASEAIKAREEKQKILAEKKKALDKANLDETKNGILAEIADGDDGADTALLPGVAGAAARATAVKGKANKGGMASLQDTLNTLGADESDAPSEFNNKLDGQKKPEPRSVSDKRDAKADALKALADDDAEEPAPAASPEKKASPLDFLKKKKEQLNQAALSSNVNTLKADAPLKGANALKESDEEAGPSAGILNRKKGDKKAKSAVDRLARLKAGLADEEEEEEADPAFTSLAGSEVEEDAPDGGISTGKTEGGRRDGPKIKLKAEEAKKGSPKLKLKEKKKKTLDAIKEKLLEPLPEEMSPEEEAEVRKELGLESQPEIKGKELARKKRAEEVKRMKDLLLEIDEELGEDGEVISQDPGQREDEKAERRQGDLSEEKRKGIRGAIDNGEDSDTDDETEERKLKRDEEKARKSAGLEDKSLYMPEKDLVPLGNAWESGGSAFVYLNAEARYKGFETLEQLLPLWIYRGDKIPELLDKTKQWRFRGQLPTQAKKVVEIPADVRDYLLGIRDQLRANGVGEDTAAEVIANSKDTRKPGKAKAGSSSALDRLRAEFAESENTAEATDSQDSAVSEEDAGEEETLSSKGSKFDKGDELSLPGEELDGLKAKKQKAGAATAEDSADEEAEVAEVAIDGVKARGKAKAAGKAKKNAASAGMDALARLREKMGESLASADEEEEESSGSKAKAGAGEAEEETQAGDRQEEEKPADDRMAKLRAQLQMDEEPAEKAAASTRKERSQAAASAEEEEQAEAEAAAESLLSPDEKKKSAKKKNDSMDRLREKLGMSEPGAGESTESGVDTAIAELNLQGLNGVVSADNSGEGGVDPLGPAGQRPASEGVRKFLERRKNKALKSMADKAARSEGPTSAVSVYLGIYVSLSDSLAQEKGAGIAVPSVLKSFESTFGDCVALCTEVPDAQNFAQVRYCSPESPEADTRIQLSSGIFEAITSEDGARKEVLGYLFLQVRGARKSFSEAEQSTLKKIARKLWPILVRQDESTESEAA